jgi:Zn-dependent metalloprotease
MNCRKKVIAASLAAFPLMLCNAATAAGPMMGAPLLAAPLLAARSLATPSLAVPAQQAALVARLAAANDKRGLDRDHGFVVAAQHPGVAGTRITRLQHTYKGVRVFQSETVLVTNDAGKIVSESVADRRAGLGFGASSIAIGGAYASFSVRASITPSRAVEMAVASIFPAGVQSAKPGVELIVFPTLATVRVAAAANKIDSDLNALDVEQRVTGYELAYLVQTRMLAGGSQPIYYDTVVSATDGHVLKQWKALKTAIGTGNSQYNGSVPISTTLADGIYSMKDPTRGVGGTYGAMAITNANHGSSPGAIYTNPANTWGDGQNYIAGGGTANANGQTAAVNALWGSMNTYDMLKNTLGWNSLDGNNTATYIAAHVFNNYDNAFYDDSCRCMYIGDGSSFKSLGAIDVIGHEMSHGVTAATSNLTYSGESGGLNESNSDIGGEAVEAYARAGGSGATIPNSGNDWMLGAEISRTGTPLRWMYKPSKDGTSPNAWSSGIGNLDVHYSSGPNNRMFYFLSQGSNANASSDYYSAYLNRAPLAMTGIGTDKAYRIWFRALTTKFTASTNYADARAKVLLSAQELYGVGSFEATAVQRAYAAINVGADVDEAGGGGALAISTNPASVTVAPGATANFSVVAAGGTAPYKYQWLRNGAAIAGATAPAYSLTAQTGDNGAAFSAWVGDSAPAPASVISSAAVLTVASNSTSEKIANGSFESGTAGWNGNTWVIGDYAGQPAYDGSRFAWLGGNGFARREIITQAVTIPSNASVATLSFALHIDTSEDTNSVPYDKMVVTVRNPAGTVLAMLATYSNLDKAAGYQVRNFNLLAFKGQTVTLSFDSTEDDSLQTSFVLDRVSLISQ